MAIDLVYSWVNPLDPALRRLRQAYLGAQPAVDLEYSAGAARYQDHGELRHSLRSAQLHLPFVRRIIVVHSGSPPAWFRPGCGAVEFVHQDEILPRELQPTFQSDLVESFIHNIPDLSEQYIYCNDDYFFARPHVPGDFFTDEGQCRVGIVDRFCASGARGSVYHQMELNSVRAVEKHLRPQPYVATRDFKRPRALTFLRTRMRAATEGVGLHNTPSHVAQPYLRSAWAGFRKTFERELNILALSRFRSRTGFAVNLAYHHYLRARGLALFEFRTDFRYLDRTDAAMERTNLREVLRAGTPPISRFCLNDSPASPDDGWSAYVASLLQELFPTPAASEYDAGLEAGPIADAQSSPWAVPGSPSNFSSPTDAAGCAI